jgi:hypothetical protein
MHNSIKHNRNRSWYFYFILFVCFLNSINAGADENNQINWAYQVGVGDGLSTGTQENANIYKLPFSYTIENFNDYDWQLKLNFPLTIGLYNIENEEQNIDLDFLAIVPGIELQIPLQDNWILMPLVNFGLGKSTSGDNIQYLYSVGIKHHVLFDWKQFDFTFGNTLRYDGHFSDSNGYSGSTPLFSTGIDMRLPLGIKLFKNPGYLSIYGMNYYYFDGIAIDVDTKTIQIDTQWELGLTFSTVPNWKIWWFSIDRVGIGYRFGDGFSSIRLVFGMPF